MILCDTSPLVALVCADEPTHEACHSILADLTEPLLTTWVCFGEAMHLVGKGRLLYRQRLLWKFVERGTLFFHNHTDAEALRMIALMVKYQNVPMDLGDASLVAAAETRNSPRIFSLDSDFHIYRLHDKLPFEVFP